MSIGVSDHRRMPDGHERLRLSDDWFPGEWLEPLHPDISASFLQRYAIGMGRMMGEYLMKQGVSAQSAARAVEEGRDTSEDYGSDAEYGIDFMNLCLLIDQRHTFPIRTVNLREGDYEPDEEIVERAAMMLQLEFDEFSDFVHGLDPGMGRREFVKTLDERYHYDGDLESPACMRMLAARAARRLAIAQIRDWFDASHGGVAASVADMLFGWKLADTAEAAEDMAQTPLRRSADAWVACVQANRRNTPREREAVMSWCAHRAALSVAWEREKDRYDATYGGMAYGGVVDRDRSPDSADADAASRSDPLPDGSIWNRLMNRMVFTHRRVSRVYARWCDDMPEEHDIRGLWEQSYLIASDPTFMDRALFALCNKIIRKAEREPADARDAVTMLLEYACVGRAVRVVPDAPAEYTYVGLRNAICGCELYHGVRTRLDDAQYRLYRAMMHIDAGASGESGHHALSGGGIVWMFPRMSEALRELSDGVHMDVMMGEDVDRGVDRGRECDDESAWEANRAIEEAVGRWMSGETIHAGLIDDHGHFLAFRSGDPVVTYQDVNAWRLTNALEMYEGGRAWGSGSRVALIYRERGHLSKQGTRPADRSVRDYGLSGRGVADTVEYIAAVAGLRAMLSSPQQVELFIRFMDACEQRPDRRFNKACWTLLRVGRSKIARLTCAGEYGRRADAYMIRMHVADPSRAAALASDLKLPQLCKAFGVEAGILAVGEDRHTVEEAHRLWVNVMNLVDMAEHYVHMAAGRALAGMRARDPRWNMVHARPFICAGMVAGEADRGLGRRARDGRCMFGRGTSTDSNMTGRMP